ncbi:hypothetical protein COW36_11685 [bacterium (Candidatus Blackallbacteria) CG17_big_fil_post_rev_8_21_14_2_50_48_46]|uniref:Polyprenyl synthetase n=1 Tax=bacterium (Candidatus Blackallbacteria) CG17_big_fil_post_rev_8_21_14_2_50_48_46 TaxID=2014261 RepID=A0A2M7G3I6_9BACT|nr:MAG: hypothetical protein COW64_03580 [bacterium (Candidatus Blackallbacteria) CG18_big_fil_WC_8_21_14_2_50_49_26]PIW16425.1 MAG: hypothetical protein COW36_11685 [bacterium (Candidatus Blackallbacteria) CG17_big_fil_post_rev_8_21_14_2_50_48_46]PIW45933.1 MAG: hypothetical protein COW20_16950 [bacterium (Candidatus Blackallbacteria) CG13_big_fil_rev_8_21_14_2_50_49_14]
MINQRFYPLFRQVFFELEKNLRIWNCDQAHARQIHRALDKLRENFFEDKVFPALMGPWLAWQATGTGVSEQALILLGAAHALFYAFLDLTDDVEDQDLDRQAWPAGSEAIAINTGTSLLFLSLLALDRLQEAEIPTERIAELRTMFAQAGWLLTAGQHRDLSSKQGHLLLPEDALRTITLKTGTSVKLYFQSAAHLAGANSEVKERLGSLGEQIGILSQIRGDYQNIWGSEISSDLQNQCHTLPVLIGLQKSTGEDRERLELALQRTPYDQAAHTLVRYLLKKVDIRTDLNLWLEKHRQIAQAQLDQLSQAGLETHELGLFLQRLKPLD